MPAASTRPAAGYVPAPRRFTGRDGRVRLMRPLVAGDEGLVSTFFHSLSPDTIRARYGYLISDMTPERAHRLVTLDPERETALGIFETEPDGTQFLCAMGRLVHAPDDESAECAFLVHDQRRRLGLASALLLALRVIGRKRRLPRLFAQVRRENRPMLAVFRKAGAQLHFEPSGDVVEVDIPLL